MARLRRVAAVRGVARGLRKRRGVDFPGATTALMRWMRELTCLGVCAVAAVAVVAWNVDRRPVAIEQDGIRAEIGVAPSVSVTATIRNETPGVQRIRAWWYVQPPESEQPWIDYNYMSP